MMKTRYIVVFRGNPILFQERTAGMVVFSTASIAVATRFDDASAAGQAMTDYQLDILDSGQCRIEPVVEPAEGAVA